ncbi:Tubby [Neofusicoccum parvum]|uniref:Tubby n=2 Tax=Neofusicoccum parvum TaxID=310453 RepID=A0ACB5SH77_9PEZI|nr:putative Tubby protein [Neofusicoccum parvum UCRNP2]GME40470.1 Tubby [Neofusicoccum parvum]GME59718.1 Tubby [Neofusicoccum parvum]
MGIFSVGDVLANERLTVVNVISYRVPVVGNVKLEILSERMVRNGCGSTSGVAHEKLIVKWKTCGKTKGKGVGALYRGISGGEQVDKITEFLGGDAKDDEEFVGLFIFEFDEEGRVFTHTIEHVEEGGNWDKMTRVISVTDWLLGKAWGAKQPAGLALGFCKNEDLYKRRPHCRSR